MINVAGYAPYTKMVLDSEIGEQGCQLGLQARQGMHRELLINAKETISSFVHTLFLEINFMHINAPKIAVCPRMNQSCELVRTEHAGAGIHRKPTLRGRLTLLGYGNVGFRLDHNAKR